MCVLLFCKFYSKSSIRTGPCHLEKTWWIHVNSSPYFFNQATRAFTNADNARVSEAQARKTAEAGATAVAGEVATRIAAEATAVANEAHATERLAQLRGEELLKEASAYKAALDLNPPPDTPVYVRVAADEFTMGSTGAQIDVVTEVCKSVNANCERSRFEDEAVGNDERQQL